MNAPVFAGAVLNERTSMATELILVADRSGEKPESHEKLDAREADSPHIDFIVHPRRSRLSRLVHRFRRDERGAVTAEYAIIILAGVAFAGLLVAIMRSSEVREMLVRLVENALGSASP